MAKIHHDIEFSRLRKKLDHTATMNEKIKLLKQIVSLNPRDSTNLTLRRKYKNELESLRQKKRMRKK